MSILYRAEMKKIVKSQLNLINKVRQILVELCGRVDKLKDASMPQVLDAATYKKMLLEETSHEVEDREEIVTNTKMNQQKKEVELHKLDLAYQRTRLVNSKYYRQLRELLAK